MKFLNLSVYYKPIKSNILIYDAQSIRFAKVLFKDEDFSIIHSRRDGVSIYIFILTLLNLNNNF